jgi:hypothetical protein
MAMVIFSDADMHGNGEGLAKQITDHGFGSDGRLVYTTSINPNSDNTITTYVWAPDWKAVAKWMDKQTTGESGTERRKWTHAQCQKIEWNHRLPDEADVRSDDWNDEGDDENDDN